MTYNVSKLVKNKYTRKVKKYALSWLAKLNGLRVRPSQGIVVNGFWRSGTTWVQELVAEACEAQMVFEPLQARAGYLRPYLAEVEAHSCKAPFVNALMPYATGALRKRSALRKLVRRALRGQLTNKHVRRSSPPRKEEYLRPSVVTKFTRGALFLESISKTFSVPALHVQRDPRACIASIRRYESWGNDIFDFSLRKHFLEFEDGRRAYFAQWEDRIRTLDDVGGVSQIAGYWGLTERYLKDARRSEDVPIAVVDYEKAVRTEGEHVLETLRTMRQTGDGKSLPGTVCHRPSSTDYRGQAGPVSTEERLYAWRSELSPREQRAVADIARRFDLADCLLE